MSEVTRTAQEEEAANFPMARTVLAGTMDAFMPERVILVIGSRWFARASTPIVAKAAAVATLRTTLHEASAFDPKRTLLISGGAKGIDRWSAEVAREIGMRSLEFCAPSGRVVLGGHVGRRWIDADLTEMAPRDAFLMRNRALVSVTAAAGTVRRTHVSVSARAIVASASETEGTRYTLGRLAEFIPRHSYVISADGRVRCDA